MKFAALLGYAVIAALVVGGVWLTANRHLRALDVERNSETSKK